MLQFFPTLFDSFSVLCAAEPVLYILSIIGLTLILYVISILIRGR